jgi:hypothetical protein
LNRHSRSGQSTWSLFKHDVQWPVAKFGQYHGNGLVAAKIQVKSTLENGRNLPRL